MNGACAGRKPYAVLAGGGVEVEAVDGAFTSVGPVTGGVLVVDVVVRGAA